MTTRTTSSPAMDQLRTHIEHQRRIGYLPGAALAVTNAQATLAVALYGVQDLGSGEPIAPETLFELGSIGKTFTAIAIMQAQAAGLLDVHAPVAAYLPWFRVQTRHAPLTPHHLLCHASGLVSSTDFAPDPLPIAYALRETVTGFAPGERHYYSNVGYKLLGLILEAVYNRPYGDIIQAGILEPLGMADSVARTAQAIRPRQATGYLFQYDDRPEDTSLPRVPAPWVETNSGDGCIVATAADMARFARCLLNQGAPLLEPESFQQMIAAQVPVGWQPWEGYGYGLYVGTLYESRTVFHAGDTPGFEAYLMADLDHGLAYVLLAARPYPWGFLPVVSQHVRAAFFGAPLPEPPQPDDKTLTPNAPDYAGVFRCGAQTLTLQAEDERVYLVAEGERVALNYWHGDSFQVPHRAPEKDWSIFLLEGERTANPEEANADESDESNADAARAPVSGFWHGGDFYAAQAEPDAPYPPLWDAITGHYRSHDVWISNFRVVRRRDSLWFVWPDGDLEPLTPLGDSAGMDADGTNADGTNADGRDVDGTDTEPAETAALVFRLGEDWSPERLRFDQVINGKAQRVMWSGGAYYRAFTP